MTDKPLAKTDSLFDQTLASLVQLGNEAREAAGATLVQAQNFRLEQASIYLDTVREFIDRPGNILGSPATKHGEIAEVAEVGVRNAWDVLFGNDPSASLHPDRIGPVDYVVDGFDVQSKFCNGVRNTLSHVAAHFEKYPDFPAGKSYYAIPDDQFDLLNKVLSGEDAGLSAKAVEALKKTIQDIEAATGRSFEEVVRPASFDYAAVQTGRIDETLDGEQDKLNKANDKRVEEIKAEHGPSLQEGLKVAAGAAAVGATVSFVGATFSKYREGKNIFKGQFTALDWKDVGLDSAKGAAIGGVTGGTVYFLTNCAGMAAPLAGATVSAVKGLAPLVDGYRRGELTLEELVDTGCMVCSEVGMVAAGAVIGQALIPVPVLGALIGTLAGKTLASILQDEVKEAAAAISARVAHYQAALDAQQRQALETLLAQFERLGDLTRAAFDVNVNADILGASVTLARTYGVEPTQLLQTTQEVDRFMMT